MGQVRQLSLFTDHRAPAKKSYAPAQPGFCAVCGEFSFTTRRETPHWLLAINRDSSTRARRCEKCRPHHDLLLPQYSRHSISPTLAVQLLYGCPLAHHLRTTQPKQPSSVENAWGTLVHRGFEAFFRTNFASDWTFQHAEHFSLDWLVSLVGDRRLFEHGVVFRQDWEGENLKRLLRQLFLFLRPHHYLRSAKELGAEIRWSATEIRLPPVTLAWLGSSTGWDFDTAGSWRFGGVVDCLILSGDEGHYQLQLIDYKIPGVDCHPELGGADYQLQLALYGAFMAKASTRLGLAFPDIHLTAKKVSLNPIGMKIEDMRFDQNVHLWALGQLSQAGDLLTAYRHASFPANPQPWLCQGCDFGFAPNLCPHSRADPGRWGLGVPYVPLDADARQRGAPPRSQPKDTASGTCEFCGAPKKWGKWGRLVCAQPSYDDCPRDDR